MSTVMNRERSVVQDLAVRGAVFASVAAALVGGELINSGSAQAATKAEATATASAKSEASAFIADKCSHKQIETINGLLAAWKANKIDDDEAKLLGLRSVDGETLEQRAKHFAKATLAVGKEVKDYGCGFGVNFGQLISVGNKLVKAGSTPIIDTLSLDAKYPDGYSLKSKAGYKKSVATVEAIALDTCANPIEGKLLVYVWVKITTPPKHINVPKTPVKPNTVVVKVPGKPTHTFIIPTSVTEKRAVAKLCDDGTFVNGKKVSQTYVFEGTGKTKAAAIKNANAIAHNKKNEARFAAALAENAKAAKAILHCAVAKPVSVNSYGVTVDKRVVSSNPDGSANLANDIITGYKGIEIGFTAASRKSIKDKFVAICNSAVFKFKIGEVVTLSCNGNVLTFPDGTQVETCEQDLSTLKNSLNLVPAFDENGCEIDTITGKPLAVDITNKALRSVGTTATPTTTPGKGPVPPITGGGPGVPTNGGGSNTNTPGAPDTSNSASGPVIPSGPNAGANTGGNGAADNN